MSTTTTTKPISGYAVRTPVNNNILFLSFLRVLYLFLVSENPFLWIFRQGKRHVNADIEGPYRVLGAPNRNIAPGKAVLANGDDFKNGAPYLFSFRLVSSSGKPISGATIDLWQADTLGEYYFRSYILRGKFQADADGRVVILTVVPGKYGPKMAQRPGHFHMVIDPGLGYEGITTQLYVCKGNDVKELESDFVNAMRRPRGNNIIQSWCIPTEKGDRFFDLPELSNKNPMISEVEDWKSYLPEGTRLLAGGQFEITLNETKPGWFF